MRENLHRFFRAARGAGVRLSPAESIDAMRAVSKVGITDRGILRDTFLLTLAKSQDEKRALGDCFDLFFSQPEPSAAAPEDGGSEESEATDSNTVPDTHGDTSGGEPSENFGPLAQMLLSQDRNAIGVDVGRQHRRRQPALGTQLPWNPAGTRCGACPGVQPSSCPSG